MNGKVTIDRLFTRVPGFDEILGGGLPEFSFNLIGGPPGCGKTTLAHQIMFALATPAQPALYLTVLGEPPLKMLRYQQQFSFFDVDAVGQSVHFANVSQEASTGDLDEVLKRIVAEVERLKPAFVFVDSFRSVIRSVAGQPTAESTQQLFVQQLGMLLTAWRATTFMIGEYPDELEANPVMTVCDGLIWMRQSVERNSMVRKMQILKMRGQPNIPGLHTFRISHDGIEVFAPAVKSTSTDAPDAFLQGPPLSIGIAGVDEMLGGGLPRGFSILVAGPSGSGKSIMAAQFLAEGARIGEKGVFAAFEQRPSRTRNATVAGLIARGSVGMVDSRAADLSIDETLRLLITEIDRVKATRVVIDSLSGFELALAPTFRQDFRESLFRMLTALTEAGVSVLMTSELEDRYTDLRFSPYGTAFLTDVIIVQRYIEVESRLRRVIAVVKVRGSNHSNELREYTIDADGLHVGQMLPEQEGLLGGRPTKKREPPSTNGPS